MRALPIGNTPIANRRLRLATKRQRPVRAKRLGNKAIPTSPIRKSRLDGTAKNPMILDKTKNMLATKDICLHYISGENYSRSRAIDWCPSFCRDGYDRDAKGLQRANRDRVPGQIKVEWGIHAQENGRGEEPPHH